MQHLNTPQSTQKASMQGQQMAMTMANAPQMNAGGQAPIAPKKSLDKDLLKTTMARVKSILVIVALFSVVINILTLTTTIYLWQISDRVLVSRSVDTLLLLTTLAVGALVLLALFEYLRRMILSRLGGYFESQLGEATFRASLSADVSQDGQLTQPLRDLAQVRGFISSPVMLFLFDAPTAPFYIFLVYLIHPWLGMLLLGGAISLFLLALINKRLTADLQIEASKHANAAFSRAQSQVQNAHIVKAMGMQSAGIRLWGTENAKAIITQIKSASRGAVINALSSFLRMMVQISILGLGAYLTLLNEVTAGSAIAASIIGGRGLAPIQGTIEGWKNYVQTKESYAKLKEILSTFLIKQTERISLPKPEGNLAVENVALSVPGQREPLLRGVSFQISRGESLAIIGPSGGGKSTLARMLVGAVDPTYGAIRLDGTSLKNWDSEEFGSHIGYLPQDIELFPGTIRDNIARFREDIPDEAIISASKITGTHDLVSRLPEGYETMLGQNGAPLSGGQRQRIALARAFFGKPCMIVLDEPNANLDNAGEQQLAKAILAAKKHGITTVMVTQRQQITQVVDKMLVIQNGTQAAFGTREEVAQSLKDAQNKSKQA